MDKERMGTAQGVPPGIGPKLPEPTPLQPRRGVTKREKLIMGGAGALVVVLLVWFISFMVSAGKSPAAAIEGYAADLPYQQHVVQVSVDGAGERYLHFFLSGDQLACALLERGAGGYRVLDAAGGLALTSSTESGIWMPLAISRSEYFIIGLVYGGEGSVEVGGVPAVTVDNGVYRCWYYRGEGPMTINSGSVVFK